MNAFIIVPASHFQITRLLRPYSQYYRIKIAEYPLDGDVFTDVAVRSKPDAFRLHLRNTLVNVGFFGYPLSLDSLKVSRNK